MDSFNRMRKRSYMKPKAFLVFLCSAALVFACSVPCAFATPSSKKNSDTLASKQAMAESISKKRDQLADELEIAGQDLTKAKEKVKETKTRVKDVKKQIKDTDEELSQAKEDLADTVQEEYKYGSVDYLSVLLDACSFDDFTSRLYLIDKIASNRAQAVEEVDALSTELEQLDSSLENSLAEQEEYEAEAKAKNAQVQSTLAEQEELLSSVTSDIQEIIDQQEAEAAAQAAQRQAEEEAEAADQTTEDTSATTSTKKKKKSTSSSSSSSSTPRSSAAWAGSTSTNGSHPEVVKIAKKYLGVPYVYGGSSPKGFDCSGLVQYCYKQIGISLSRVACDQYNDGLHIAKSALMPGDLVFFGSSAASIHHVGIYCGDGQFIHAPQTGDVVKISYLSSRSDYYGACRP